MTVATESPSLGAPESATRRADEASAGAGRGGWRALATQPLLVAAGVLAFGRGRANATRAETGARQLGWTALWTGIRERLLLTVAAAVIVLLIAVPLGIALTRRPLRRFSPLISGIANTGQAANARAPTSSSAGWTSNERHRLHAPPSTALSAAGTAVRPGPASGGVRMVAVMRRPATGSAGWRPSRSPRPSPRPGGPGGR